MQQKKKLNALYKSSFLNHCKHNNGQLVSSSVFSNSTWVFCSTIFRPVAKCGSSLLHNRLVDGLSMRISFQQNNRASSKLLSRLFRLSRFPPTSWAKFLVQKKVSNPNRRLLLSWTYKHVPKELASWCLLLKALGIEHMTVYKKSNTDTQVWCFVSCAWCTTPKAFSVT